MKRMLTKLLLSFLVLLLPGWVNANDPGKKARVIVMTDGETDDKSSMIRFLLYSCDVDLQAIIETNSVWQRSGHSKEDWFEKLLTAYEQVYPNLIKHNPNYPTATAIRSKNFVGDEDPNHLYNLDKTLQKPGHVVEYMPDNWPNTPGSDKIVEILLDADPSPVHIQTWGGGNTASKAFYKLKKYYPAEYDRAISKVVMYNIWYQDDAGNYIEQYHPKVTMIYNSSFDGTWDYGSLLHTTDFVTNHVKNNHGPLGALYPQKYVSEGDTPALLYSLQNELRNFENPGFGGWGGRFTKLTTLPNVYTDAYDDGDVKKSLRRWINQANADFQARMDWCVAQTFSAANHIPVINLNVTENLAVTSGQTITLSADGSTDPDGNALSYKWWQYKEAGSYPELVSITNATSKTATFVVPDVTGSKTMHVILEVADNGSPALTAYKHLIITFNPNDETVSTTPAPAPTPNPITPIPTTPTAPTTPTTCTATGTILREQWNNISGTSVSTIPVNTTPSSKSNLTLFEAPSNVGSLYGSRIRGYICPPQTGSYTFYISGDDNAELWLSTDENPANKKKIAGFTGWTNPREWTKYTGQRSAVITLTAGRRYYVEALHKEEGRLDHVAVGWQLPNGTLERPIAGSRLSPFVSTTTTTPAPTPTTPSTCTATGTILREQWNNISGTSVSAIPVNKTPSSKSNLTLFEAPSNVGSLYGSRIRGYICPPQTGSYTFYISGDDNAELWLSTDENPANKKKIAGFTGWTNPREWTKYTGQRSAVITLTAGRRYYVEALHKEEGRLDHVAVGWQLPNGTLERPIAGSRLSPFVTTTTAPLTTSKNGQTDLLETAAVVEPKENAFLAYPNPFGTTVNLSFTLPTEAAAVVQVYSLQGTLVATLFKGTVKAGQHQEVSWTGDSHAAGVYIAKLTYGNQILHKRLLLQR